MANAPKKGAVVIAVIVAIALLMLIILWPHTSSASTEEEPVVVEPDPYSPTETPTQGCYYHPKAGDGDALIVQKAGLAPVLKSRRVMRDHARNAWIPKTTRSGETETQLDLDWGYAHLSKAGLEYVDWAWNTAHVASGGYAICVPYVPTQEEVDKA